MRDSAGGMDSAKSIIPGADGVYPSRFGGRCDQPGPAPGQSLLGSPPAEGPKWRDAVDESLAGGSFG